jgi:hypothetical protein
MVMYVLSMAFPTELFLCSVPVLIVLSDRSCSGVAICNGMARKAGLRRDVPGHLHGRELQA